MCYLVDTCIWVGSPVFQVKINVNQLRNWFVLLKMFLPIGIKRASNPHQGTYFVINNQFSNPDKTKVSNSKFNGSCTSILAFHNLLVCQASNIYIWACKISPTQRGSISPALFVRKTFSLASCSHMYQFPFQFAFFFTFNDIFRKSLVKLLYFRTNPKQSYDQE